MPSKKKPAKNGPTTMSLEEATEILMRGIPEKLRNSVKDRVRADAKLQFDYPDEFVAYLDTYTGRGRNRRFSRQILAHSHSEIEVMEEYLRLPEEIRNQAEVHYIRDPEGPLNV
jgi:hypothetical protein